VPRCRYLVIVDDIEYYLALAFCDAFGVHDLPGVASSFARENRASLQCDGLALWDYRARGRHRRAAVVSRRRPPRCRPA